MHHLTLLALISLSAGAPLSGLPTTSLQADPAANTVTGYRLNTAFTSANLFSAFTFFNDTDPTQGHVVYQSRKQASAKSLAGRLPGVSQQPIFLGVDHTTPLTSDGRASVRVQSSASWMHGLFVFDIAHMPTGCGTWPAAWLVGTEGVWPTTGEIDILEGVNDQIGNRMTLHTTSGCSVGNASISSAGSQTQSTPSSTRGVVTAASASTVPNPENERNLTVGQDQTSFSGTLTTADCDVNASNQAKNAGCQIADNNPLSYGTSFNQAGGGVFAVEWTSQGIAIWFFSHDAKDGSGIPNDLATALGSRSVSSANTTSTSASKLAQAISPDPSTWPAPSARFMSGSTPGSSCDFDKHFQNQSIVINTSLCGDWAGAQGVWDASPLCAAKASSCTDFVTNNPSAFQDSFWAINQIQIWQK